MILSPDRQTFDRMQSRTSRVPVFGEVHLPGLDPALLFKHLWDGNPHSFLLESGKGPGPTARYSLMGTGNSTWIEIRDQVARFQGPEGPPRVESPDAAFERLNFHPRTPVVDYLPHFWGGWVGFLGYEAGRLFETLPPPKPGPRSWPDLWFMQVDRLLVYDHFTQTLKIIAAPEKSGTGKDYPRLAEEIRQRWDRIKCVLESCRVSPVAADLLPSPPLSPGFSNGGNGYRANLTRRDYLDRVRRVKAFIQEGDIYQANLAQRFETEFDGHPLDLYLELRRVNPSPFSAFLQADGGTVVSSSPERLVRVDGGAIETRPIAGTRPRGHSPESDRLLSAELLLNEKERAEHLMLVDLERNDLGRICRTGSVRVTDLMFLEQYSHVSHIVSNIAGTLSPKTSVKEILRALFPGGTITGCPKIRCMEIIHELEPGPRNLYCGSLGYIGFSRHLDLNILIRTLFLQNGKADFHVGAGIVADSLPEKEYQETLDKAAAMMLVLSTSETRSRS